MLREKFQAYKFYHCGEKEKRNGSHRSLTLKLMARPRIDRLLTNHTTQKKKQEPDRVPHSSETGLRFFLLSVRGQIPIHSLFPQKDLHSLPSSRQPEALHLYS